MLFWLLAGVALLLSVIAFAAIRRLSRRLDGLTQSYWELRYDYTRLRSRLERLDPDDAPAAGSQGNAPAAGQPSPSVTFVPLSSIRKKDKTHGD